MWMMWRRGGIVTLVWTVLCAGLWGPAWAYPDRPLTLIVPWGAGGGTDAVARFIATELEKAVAAGKKVDMKKLDKVLSSSIKGVVKKQIECGIDSLRQAIDGDDHRSIRSAIDRLNKLTDAFAARRMDRSIQRALTGRTIASL